MPIIDEITRESWIMQSCPEWGTYLNEEIEECKVPEGNVSMWWLGCTGLWMKTPGNCNLSVDLWVGNGKRTQKDTYMRDYHQMRNMCGGRLNQPNRRTAPFVIDPFAVKQIDAVFATHYHRDHIDPNFAAAVLKNVKEPIPFIGPKEAVKLWVSWGVPEERCKIVKPGDTLKIKDVEVVVLDSFDRTCLVTTDGSDKKDIRHTCPDDMDDKAVNYLFKTPGGNIYHSGDSHYSIYFAKHGKDHHVDVALASFGENPIGLADKMTSCDVLRMAEALQCEVVIPIHYDIWSNMMADPYEIEYLWKFKKAKLQYKFHPFQWEVGGKYTYPQDKNLTQYHYRRGFEDCFIDEPNVPFRSIL